MRAILDADVNRHLRRDVDHPVQPSERLEYFNDLKSLPDRGAVVLAPDSYELLGRYGPNDPALPGPMRGEDLRYRSPAVGQVYKVKLKQDIILCRVGTPSERDPFGLGGWLSPFKVSSKDEARELFAVLPEWGNDLTQVIPVRVKADTEIYISKAGKQTATEGPYAGQTFGGGATQVYVHSDWRAGDPIQNYLTPAGDAEILP